MVGRRIFAGVGQTGLDLRLITEHLQNLFVCSDTESAHQNRDRYFTGTVNADIEHIIGIRLILKPCTSVRNDLAGVQLFSGLVE